MFSMLQISGNPPPYPIVRWPSTIRSKNPYAYEMLPGSTS